MPTDRTPSGSPIRKSTGRPRGYTVTASEARVLREWRDALDGVTEDLALRVGVGRAHLSQGLSGSVSLSRKALTIVLRLLRETSEYHWIRLDAVASPDLQTILRGVHYVPTVPPPVAGRGRATSVAL